MPVCVSCTNPAPYLYTTYRTKSNIRLGVCTKCGQFLDPLIEHPNLIILLDLILLKPRVYLHLLYNRGTLPFDATAEVKDAAPSRSEASRRNVLFQDFVRLAAVMLGAEVVLRCMPLALKLRDGIMGQGAWWMVLRVASSTIADIGSQLAVTTAVCLLVLWRHGWFPARNADRKRDADGRRANFMPIVIPLTVLYTSILPVLLQLFLSIWHDPHTTSSQTPTHHSEMIPAYLLQYVPPSVIEPLQTFAAELLDTWSGVDKVWAGTRLLGGMSAGFGLRVVLPTRPWETMLGILSGWIAGTWMREQLLLD